MLERVTKPVIMSLGCILCSARDDSTITEELLNARQSRMREMLQHCVRDQTWHDAESIGLAGSSSSSSSHHVQEQDVFRATQCFSWLVGCGRPEATLVAELYAGSGHLSRGLASGLSRVDHASLGRHQGLSSRPGRHLLLTFEGDPLLLPDILGQLMPHRREALDAEPVTSLPRRLAQALFSNETAGGVLVAVVRGSAYPSEICPYACGRVKAHHWQGQEIRDCFKCPEPGRGESALRNLCEALLGSSRRLDFVLLDTASPGIEEWFVLERYCRPRHVFLINARLPMHQGWVADRLLRTPGSSWREIDSGLTEWSSIPWPGMKELLRYSSFQILADLEEEPMFCK